MEKQSSFDLIETMRFDPEDGIAELERHLARMKRSAEALGFAFDRHHARNELQAATFFLRGPRRLRLRLSPTGALAIETRPLSPPPQEPVPVSIKARPAEWADPGFSHRSSLRAGPDAEDFEELFTDSDGFLTEGRSATLFVEKDGKLVTPPLARDVVPGILRERLLEEGRAVEGELRPHDLKDGFFLGASATGLIAARLTETDHEGAS